MSKLKLVVSSLLIAGVTVLTGCATSAPYQPSVGDHQCATACSNKISNSIVSQLRSDNMVKDLPITVSTCHRVVRVSGTVYNHAQLDRVLYIASHTHGVALVKTSIMVRDPFVNH